MLEVAVAAEPDRLEGGLLAADDAETVHGDKHCGRSRLYEQGSVAPGGLEAGMRFCFDRI